MTGRLSLLQQLAQLNQPAPVDFDPEDLTIHERGPDNEEEADVSSSAAREHYFEVGPSSLRKLHDSIADPKYEGVKTSRRKLAEESDEENGEDGREEDSEVPDDEEREQDAAMYDEPSEDEMLSDEEVSDDQEEDEDDEGDNEDYEEEEEDGEKETEGESEGSAPSPKRPTSGETEQIGDLKTVLQKTREEDLRKGKAVVRQLSTWDSLVDARIRLQKTLTTVNQVMSPTSRSTLGSPECQEDLQKYLQESILLTEDLFELQETILTANEVVTPPPRKRRRLQDDDDIEKIGTYFVEASSGTAQLEHALHPWLVQTLAKWSAKIQAVAPSVLLPSNRNAFSKSSQQVKTAVQLVDEALLDYTRLLGKTQVLRGKARNEAADDKGKDPEVFDDTDFYQQMLRDVIESRGDGASGVDDWVTLQREKKAKKKVDTKASKGRKLRYEVHEKLQNFMVPVLTAGTWHEEQIDELFGSLLGKGFENSLTGGADALDSERTLEVDDVMQGGFRVFG